VAAYCSVWPTPMESATGVTEIDNRTAGITVSRPVPAILVEGSVAVIVLAPVAKPLARPPVDTEAADVFEEDHVTVEVRDLVLRSEYVPVAAYCSVWPTPMESATGATEIDNRIGGNPSACADSVSAELSSPAVARTENRTTLLSLNVRLRCRKAPPPRLQCSHGDRAGL